MEKSSALTMEFYLTLRTPYQRVMESSYIPDTTKSRLRSIYLSLNPAQLKKGIERKLKNLYKVYQEKNNKKEEVNPCKRQKPLTVTF